MSTRGPRAPGALAGTETITVTALAGSHVAYRFTPHLAFDQDVSLVQQRSTINSILLLGLLGGHFDGDVPSLVNGLALVTESAPATVSIFAGTVSFTVRHFSGWLVASGNGGEPPPDSSGSSSQ